MKRIRIVPSNKPVTTVVVAGKPHHYFHSEVLGTCRAIIIAEEENLPSRPGEALNDLQLSMPELFAEKSHVDLVNEEIELFEQKQAEKEAAKDLCKNCVQGGWFIDPKDNEHKFMMPPYPGVDTICKVCGGYASPERKMLGHVRWGENK